MKNQLEQRINELETKVAFQDDTIDALNHELKQHQESIQKMQNQLNLLGSRFQEIKDGISEHQGSGEIEHELPPHY